MARSEVIVTALALFGVILWLGLGLGLMVTDRVMVRARR